MTEKVPNNKIMQYMYMMCVKRKLKKQVIYGAFITCYIKKKHDYQHRQNTIILKYWSWHTGLYDQQRFIFNYAETTSVLFLLLPCYPTYKHTTISKTLFQYHNGEPTCANTLFINHTKV